ncbi:MAG: hypothetical protein CMD39_02915 [Gammaproteobacteria bacterium]|nr:hypothetical protein [Gammaproteobacteria bacterium]|tara:strand:- start:1552 stop:1884 length:333 start_codon:yes stop_codon:yes gene_type:complete
MGRSERERFNDHVASLLRRLGIEVDELPDGQRRDLIEQARDRHDNEHEAALYIGYALVPAVLADDVEKGRVLIDRLAVTAEAWDDEELVDRSRLRDSDSSARAALRRALR